MKILLVNKFLYPRGGAESYMLKIGQCLSELGHTVEYFGMYDAQNTVTNSAGAYTQNMDFHSSSLGRFLYPFKIIYSLEAKRKIGKVLDKFQPDVVHLNNINFQLTPSVIDAVKKRGIPLIQTVHDYQMVCPNHLLYDFQRKCVCEKCVGRSKVYCIQNRCIHGSRIKSLLGFTETLFYKIKGTYKKVDLYLCPSRFLAGELLKNQPKLYENKITVLHNFVEQKVPPTTEDKAPYIAFAGRLSPEKGTALLAQTAKLLPEVHFVVMGSGPDEKAFEGLENVTMTGFVTGEKLDRLIAGAAAMAVPSICFENCPLAILEAQMLGVPSVTMNMGGMAELVEDGVTGILSSAPTATAFAAAVKEILSDPERLAQMKQNCREKAAAAAIPLESYCKKLLEIYLSLK